MHANTLHYTGTDDYLTLDMQVDLNRTFGFTIGRARAFADAGFGEFEQVDLTLATDWVHDGIVNGH